MTARHAVQNVRFQHGVVGDTAQLDAVVLQDAAIVLQVLPHLERFVIFQQRFEQLKHAVTGDLVRRVQIVMRDRNIGGDTRLCGKG
ncbi:hypothetical protein D3C85_1569210 [compost metagenome]